TGFTVNCPESGASVLSDLREIAPTYFFAPPRIWESILTSVMIRIEDAAWIKRRLVHACLARARAMGPPPLTGTPAPRGRRGPSPRGGAFVSGPLKDNVGMRRIRRAYTAGEAIGPEIFVFCRSLGINVKQLYGMTESSALVAIHQDGDVRLDTVGTPLPGVEVKISEEGQDPYR